MKELLLSLVALGPWGLLLAAVLDGAGVPVPSGVDVLIVFLAARLPEQILLLTLMAVTGSTAGNLFLFSVARKGGQIFLEKRTTSRRGLQFRRWFDHYGLLTIFISALVPLPIMPMKIFVLCSGALGASAWQFVLVFVCARIPRYLALAYLGRSMGANALEYLKSHVWHLTGFALLLFAVLWAMIKIADKRRELQLTAKAQS
ncbi:MAG: VTT domain-containing protein [Bryobacteraceae bacterium]|nr:VTT domain-containing protein [Bryobacteraceae bacterium]